jgi:hypothetical protein
LKEIAILPHCEKEKTGMNMTEVAKIVIGIGVPILWIVVPLLLWVGVFFLLRKTYKIRNRILQWGLILIPPLLLFAMIFVPWDIGTTMIWLVVYIIFLISLFKLCVYLWKILLKHNSEIRIQLIRPLLTMAVIIISRILVSESLVSADSYAVKMAMEIQEQVNKNSKCPEHLEGWEQDRYSVWYKLYGKYGTKYRVRYDLSKDKQEFTFSVRHNIDEGFHIAGGVGKTLQAKISVNGHSRDIPIAAD